MFSVNHTNPRLISAGHLNPKVFGIAQLNARLISVVHQNPSVFNAIQVRLPVTLYVNAVTLNRLVFAYSDSITVQLGVYNSGREGSGPIYWEVVDNNDTVLSSGTAQSGIIARHSSATVNITGITAPAFNTSFRVRARASEFASWTDSLTAHAYPAGLSIQAVNPWNDIYTAGNSVACVAFIANAGAEVSRVVEWQVINMSDQSVISSGSNSSAAFGEYSAGDIDLIGITAPVTANTTARIRTRLQGDTEWVNAVMPLLNFIPKMPPNPDPRSDVQNLIFEPPAEEMSTVITDGSENIGPGMGEWIIDPLTGFWFDPIAGLWMDPMGTPVDPQPAPPFPFFNPPSELI